MARELVCIVCPMGCRLTLEAEAGGWRVDGSTCERGRAYAVQEVTAPIRTLTSTVRIEGGRLPRLPVRTSAPVPRERLEACMEVINRVSVRSPVAMGQVLVPDLLGTGVDLVASRSM
jgi:CxxC motif-containing protein